jgi:uncharacterized protein (TIGR02266 family)
MPGEDRRESRRVPIRLLVRDHSQGGSFEERDGNLGLGGVYFREAHPPQGSHVELRFVLPGTRAEISARGEVIHVDRDAEGFGAHVRFSGLPLEQELAIARFLDRA